MRKSTPASISARARLSASSPTPIAAPTTNLPPESLVANGYLSLLTKSLTVKSPRRRPSESMSGSFSTLRVARSCSAASGEIPTWAVTSGIRVITSCAGLPMSSSKRMSRLVTMPTRTPAASTTGTPEMRYRPQSRSTSASESFGEHTIGLVTMPASERLTRSTCVACSSIGKLRCSTPTPPLRAIAMAMRASVTVSMALDTSGTRTLIFRVTREVVSTSLGTTSDCAGKSKTSSKVRPR